MPVVYIVLASVCLLADPGALRKKPQPCYIWISAANSYLSLLKFLLLWLEDDAGVLIPSDPFPKWDTGWLSPSGFYTISLGASLMSVTGL